MGKLLVIGSLNMDMVITVSHIPKPGETILGKTISYTPGGKGANQAYAMGKLGGNVTMIGCVGKDENGQKLLKNLNSVLVDTTPIQIVEKEPTGMAFITVEETGENSITVLSGANFLLEKEYILQQKKYIEECDILVMQLESPIESIAVAAKLAKEKGKIVLLDPAPAQRDFSEEILKNISIIKPNETELEILTGMPAKTEEEIVLAANVLLKKGVEQVVVTLGEKGAIFVTKEGYQKFSAKKVQAIDTTAAGDAFTAGLAVKLSQGASMEEAIAFATTVSSVVVTKFGAQASIPTAQEVYKVL